MDWVKRGLFGEGAFERVYQAQSSELLLASCSNDVPFMALKCARASHSSSLQHEKDVYNNLEESTFILKFLGSSRDLASNGTREYSLALEYTPRGSLQKQIEGGSLPESVVRPYTKMMLKGLHHVHRTGFVHCDLKPDNILLFPSRHPLGDVRLKLADFGRAKRH